MSKPPMSTLKILLVSEDIPYPNMGGLAKHVLNLARALVRAGHQVDLLGHNEHPIEVCGEEGRFGGRFFGELHGQHAGWKEVRFGMFMPYKRTAIARRFARIILRHAPNYDVIHYHGHFPNIGRYIPAHINFVQTRHDQGSDCFRHTRFRAGAICSEADPAACATCITPEPNVVQNAVSTAAVVQFRGEVADSFRRHKTVFVSDMLQHKLARTLGPGPWGTTIHNFVDTDVLQQARSTAPASNPARFHVAVSGKLYQAKGIEAFLSALQGRMPANMVVTVAGDGRDEARLRAQFEGENIRFLGWCTPEKTLEVAAAADAIVVPSLLEEAFGLTTLEGLLLGKATFALAHGATPELSIYAATPTQLRLHPDLDALVDDLLRFDRTARFDQPRLDLAAAANAVRQLLEVYRAPAHSE